MSDEAERRYLNAIARRNTTWAYWRDALQLLEVAESRYEGAELTPYRRNANEAQHDHEHAVRDLVRARVHWRADRQAAA